MNTIATHLEQVKVRISQAELHHHRSPGSVLLVAVSKTHSIKDILTAFEAGQRHFAENYLQEAIPKINATRNLDIAWHFIGGIQSNKTAAIAKHFSWVQSISSLAIATALNNARIPNLPPLNVCIQVNVSQESTKAGISFSELPKLALDICGLPRLKLRGIMCIPAFSHSEYKQKQSFALCREAFMSLKAALPSMDSLDTLSMGMSNDLESAISEKSTMVRIGTSIFGARIPNPKYRPSLTESNKTGGEYNGESP